jgi:HSP20 family protein
MSSTRWDPLNDLVSLREAMNNLLEESFIRPRGEGGGEAPRPGGAPAGLAIDIRETPQAFVVKASVPGVRPEDVDITVLGDTLRITGQHQEQSEVEPNARWLIRERRSGTFERTVRLPTGVQSGAAEADFKDGVLTVTLPKAEEARPRSIPVLGRQGSQPAAVDVGSGGSEHQAGGQSS